MKHSIKYVELNQNGTIFTVMYTTGTEKAFTRSTLPGTIRKFIMNADIEKTYKIVVPVITKDWKVYEQVYYRIMA